MASLLFLKVKICGQHSKAIEESTEFTVKERQQPRRIWDMPMLCQWQSANVEAYELEGSF